MEKEKKEIKISLWTFYVLMAGIVVLIAGVIIGGLNVARQNAEFSGTIFEFGNEREVVYNKKYAFIADKLWHNIYLEPDSDHRTSFEHEEKLTLANIDNQTKLEVAIHKIIIESGTIKWFLMDKFGIDAKEVEKSVVEVFGENATIEHENISSLGLKYANGKYIETVDNLQEYEENASVYAGPIKAILNDGEIIVYEEYVKKIYNSATGINTLYATGDNKLKILEYKEEEWSIESPYEKIVMPVYKHTFKENDKGKYYWVSSELVNKDELKIVENTNTTNISYVDVSVEDTSAGELAYKSKRITDKQEIKSLMDIIESATVYETKSFIADFGDCPPSVEIYDYNGVKYTIAAGDEIDDAGSSVNLMTKWYSEDGSDKTLYKVESKLGEYIEKLYNNK